MLDIKFIRENLDKVKKGVAAKQMDVALVDRVLKLYDKWTEKLQTYEELRQERNKIARESKGYSKIGKKIKEELVKAELEVHNAYEEYVKVARNIPNPPAPDVKVGKDETENEVIKKWGEKPKFDFQPRDHLELGELLDIIDVERAAKVSGSRFGYLKNEAVILEFALVKFALENLLKEGFTPVIPPVMISLEAMSGMGYFEHGGAENMYLLKDDDLVLVGTSEQSIGPMHMDEVLDGKKLPLRYVGFSTCFRREAGAYGKDTRGILRVHQFDKVEMFSFTKPEWGDKEHEYFLSLEEKLVQALKIPYQVVKMCTGDLGIPTARKYDIECWMPSQNKYRETHSTSTCTDYQARRLNIKYKKNNETEFVHTVNGTAFAIGRTLIAILENYQEKDGSVVIPKVLVPYCGFTKILPKDNR